jgi:hypothetical protein
VRNELTEVEETLHPNVAMCQREPWGA